METEFCFRLTSTRRVCSLGGPCDGLDLDVDYGPGQVGLKNEQAEVGRIDPVLEFVIFK